MRWGNPPEWGLPWGSVSVGRRAGPGQALAPGRGATAHAGKGVTPSWWQSFPDSPCSISTILLGPSHPGTQGSLPHLTHGDVRVCIPVSWGVLGIFLGRDNDSLAVPGHPCLRATCHSALSMMGWGLGLLWAAGPPPPQLPTWRLERDQPLSQEQAPCLLSCRRPRGGVTRPLP